MPYTILDIAQRAGVSKSTVSRYIKGERDKVSAKTQAKIAKVIKELDYRPNQIAVGLARRQLPQIGVVMSDISNPFSSVAMKSIFDACVERGQAASFALSDGNFLREQECVKNFMAFNIDRLVIHTCGHNDEFLSTLDPRKTVIIDRAIRDSRFVTVTSDNYESTFNAIRHLQSTGCEPIAFVSPDLDGIATRSLRYESYLDAIEGRQEHMLVSYSSPENMEAKLADLFATRHPKGVFTVNGEALKAFLRFAKKRSLRVGEDVGVVSYEDWDWTELVTPTITAVRQDSYQMGYVAASMLLDGELADDNAPDNMKTIKSELIVRQSSRLR